MNDPHAASRSRRYRQRHAVTRDARPVTATVTPTVTPASRTCKCGHSLMDMGNATVCTAGHIFYREDPHP